jgi:hypothetical protein
MAAAKVSSPFIDATVGASVHDGAKKSRRQQAGGRTKGVD